MASLQTTQIGFLSKAYRSQINAPLLIYALYVITN